MLRKPVFPRIFFIALLYLGLFVLLVSVQFAKGGGFTVKVGNFVVSGRYRQQGENDPHRGANEYYLDGDVHVSFGGMDFGMVTGKGEHSLYFEDKNGVKTEKLPERMIISEDSVLFVFPGGTELGFATQHAGGSLEMRITGVFSEDVAGIELPFKPQRRAGIRDTGNGQFVVILDGINYSFGNSPIDLVRRMLHITAEGRPVSYRIITESNAFSPGDYILPQAETVAAYGEFLARWKEQNYSLWSRAISGLNNEDVVLAFEEEALARGSYRAAVTAVSPLFLGGTARTFESSVYLGGLDQAYRSLNALEQEKLARLSRQISDMSLEFLIEPRVVEYLAVRGRFDLIENGVDLVRTIDTDILALDIVPGILEGYTDWKIFLPGRDNPFERLVDEACFAIVEALRRTTNTAGNQDALANRVFVLHDGEEDAEFNLRLGKALMAYAETTNNNSWAGIGRSIVLSALSQGDASGPEPATARLYRILNPSPFYPRAVAISASPNIWAWTAASEVSVVQQNNNVLDIAVTFPAGEAHYMIIRGIQPFSRIQLYGIDYRTDPQFERYDSSGWSYVSQEQTLLLKMRHRATVENIRIIFREGPPVTTPVPVITNNTAAGEGTGTP